MAQTSWQHHHFCNDNLIIRHRHFFKKITAEWQIHLWRLPLKPCNWKNKSGLFNLSKPNVILSKLGKGGKQEAQGACLFWIDYYLLWYDPKSERKCQKAEKILRPTNPSIWKAASALNFYSYCDFSAFPKEGLLRGSITG